MNSWLPKMLQYACLEDRDIRPVYWSEHSETSHPGDRRDQHHSRPELEPLAVHEEHRMMQPLPILRSEKAQANVGIAAGRLTPSRCKAPSINCFAFLGPGMRPIDVVTACLRGSRQSLATEQGP
jgi:hypothetical protein